MGLAWTKGPSHARVGLLQRHARVAAYDAWAQYGKDDQDSVHEKDWTGAYQEVRNRPTRRTGTWSPGA